MNTAALKLLAIVVSGSALLAASLPAEAGRDRYEYRERIDYRDHGKKHHKRERVVIKERTTIVHRPVVREVHHYYEPAPAYFYSRDPAVVIGVSIPPLVIPLR